MVYMDDIVLTCNDDVEMKMLKASLAKEFEMKDLGEFALLYQYRDGSVKEGSSSITI
jgi:hypothetical protein